MGYDRGYTYNVPLSLPCMLGDCMSEQFFGFITLIVNYWGARIAQLVECLTLEIEIWGTW